MEEEPKETVELTKKEQNELDVRGIRQPHRFTNKQLALRRSIGKKLIEARMKTESETLRNLYLDNPVWKFYTAGKMPCRLVGINEDATIATYHLEPIGPTSDGDLVAISLSNLDGPGMDEWPPSVLDMIYNDPDPDKAGLFLDPLGIWPGVEKKE